MLYPNKINCFEYIFCIPSANRLDWIYFECLEFLFLIFFFKKKIIKFPYAVLYFLLLEISTKKEISSLLSGLDFAYLFIAFKCLKFLFYFWHKNKKLRGINLPI